MTEPPVSPPPILLDVTRLLRRVGRVHTGVDRVEFAYLQHFLNAPNPLFGLLRSRFGYLLLDRDGLAKFGAAVAGRRDWGAVDLLSRYGATCVLQKQAEADLRRWALGRALPMGLKRLLRRYLPARGYYLNIGHSNLTDRVLAAVRPWQRVVMIHDTIPLDFPQYQRPGSVEPFAKMLHRVGQSADLILCNSAQTRADLQRHLGQTGQLPRCEVVPLGVEVAAAAPLIWPGGFDPARPYFVTLGTIEPRKNHKLLLDVWDQLAAQPEPPQLLICGQRGWNNEAVFTRLDDCAARPGPVFEMAGLSDGQIASLLQSTRGFLFPSHAEGYGLPPMEAAMLGCPVLCSDLPLFRELLGNNAIYLPGNDHYPWTIKITEMAQDPQAEPARKPPEMARFVPPDWGEHFNLVLRLLC